MADLHPLDHEIRALLVRELPESFVTDALATARMRLAAEMELDGAPERRRPVRRRFVLPRLQPARAALVLGAVALALFVTVALDPFGARDSELGVPHLEANASAAETLRWAGAVIGQHPTAGTGDVLHASQVTTTDGVETERRDLWIGTGARTYRTVWAYVAQKGAGDVLHVDDFDGRVERLRSYTRQPGRDWALTGGDFAQLDVVGGAAPHAPSFGRHPSRPDHHGMGASPNSGYITMSDDELAARRRANLALAGPAERISVNMTVEGALHRWIVEADDAADEDALLEATARFMASTRGYFAGAGEDQSLAAVRATSVRQLLYLAETAPVTDDALQLLYDRVATLGNLKRLDDVTVDGRRAARIQFDGVDASAISPDQAPEPADRVVMLEQLRSTPVVLVLDLTSGRILRLESVDRSVVRELGRPEYVAHIGDGADGICGPHSVLRVRCSLVSGGDPLSRLAEARAQSPRSRVAAISEATGATTLGDGDRPAPRDPGLLPWSPDLPEGAL